MASSSGAMAASTTVPIACKLTLSVPIISNELFLQALGDVPSRIEALGEDIEAEHTQAISQMKDKLIALQRVIDARAAAVADISDPVLVSQNSDNNASSSSASGTAAMPGSSDRDRSMISAAAIATVEEAQVWICDICTVENELDVSECTVCGAARGI